MLDLPMTRGAAGLRIREAQPGDESMVLDYVRRLAKFEGCADSVHATEENLRRDLFDTRIIHAAFAQSASPPERGGEPAQTVGFALWYYSYSTFRGKPGLYLEDIYVDRDYRERGVGRELFAFLRDAALLSGCDRIEWSVLSWNEDAKAFYRAAGGTPHEGWETWRMELAETRPRA